MQPQDEEKAKRYFPDLDIDEIIDKAEDWVSDYSCIERIELYRAGSCFAGSRVRYVIVVAAPDNPYRSFPKDGSRWFRLEYKDIKLEDRKECFEQALEPAMLNYPDLDDLIEYHRWASSEWASPESVENIRHEIPSFYLKRWEDDDPDGPKIEKWDLMRVEEWRWFKINPGEHIFSYHEKASEIVKEQVCIELYPQKEAEIPFLENDDSINPEYERAFICRGATWDIYFDGEKKSIKDIKPIELIIPALENPYNLFEYIDLVNTEAKVNSIYENDDSPLKGPTQKQLDEQNLTVKHRIDGDVEAITKRDAIKQFNKLKAWYETKKNNSNADKKQIEKAIKLLQDQIRHTIYEDKKTGTLHLGRELGGKDYRNAMKKVSNAKTRILDSLNKVNFMSLRDHLKDCLIVKAGLIYTPPEESPPWYIRANNE